MHLRPDGTFVRTDIWREGKWIDLWSVVHFLSGASLGFAIHFLGFDGLSAAVIALLLMIVYEFWEAAVKIKEYGSNRFADVIIGMASFSIAVFYIVPMTAGSREFYEISLSVFGINILLSVLGWKASVKAAAFERKLREKYKAERRKFVNITHFPRKRVK